METGFGASFEPCLSRHVIDLTAMSFLMAASIREMTMIIQFGLYKRAPGISREEYIRLWTVVYGALNGQIPELSRHLHRYVQHVLTPAPGTPDELAFDGMSEAWFVSEAAMRALPEEPAFKERIAPFTRQFIDVNATRLNFSDAPVYQIGGPPALVNAPADYPG